MEKTLELSSFVNERWFQSRVGVGHPDKIPPLPRIGFQHQGGNFHLKVGGAKSSGNAGDPMLGVAVIP